MNKESSDPFWNHSYVIKIQQYSTLIHWATEGMDVSWSSHFGWKGRRRKKGIFLIRSISVRPYSSHIQCELYYLEGFEALERWQMTEVLKRGVDYGNCVSSTKNKFIILNMMLRSIFKRRKLSQLFQTILQQARI